MFAVKLNGLLNRETEQLSRVPPSLIDKINKTRPTAHYSYTVHGTTHNLTKTLIAYMTSLHDLCQTLFFRGK